MGRVRDRVAGTVIMCGRLVLRLLAGLVALTEDVVTPLLTPLTIPALHTEGMGSLAFSGAGFSLLRSKIGHGRGIG